jgi:hypothetical protein
MRALPSPTSTFSSLRRPGHLYFDRTEPLFRLAAAASPTMVCRPTGFGKSLACSALECLLKGRRKLFEGLWIESSGWSWEPHEVIHLRLEPDPDLQQRLWGGSLALDRDMIASKLASLIEREAAAARLQIGGGGPGRLLRSLMVALHEKRGRKVAVIIDDVDAPLWPVLGMPGEAAVAMETLGDLLSALEGPEPWRGPVFLAGTLRLPLGPAPGRPGLSTLRDATFDPSMAAFAGLAGGEIRALAAERLPTPAALARAYESLNGPGEASRGLTGDPAELIMDVWGGYGWGGPAPLANTRRVLGFFQAAPDGDPPSKRVRQGLMRTPIEPCLARYLAGALEPYSVEGPEDSAGLAGLPLLQTPPAPPDGGPAIDPGRPDPVALASQIGLLAPSGLAARHNPDSPFPAGGVTTLTALWDPVPAYSAPPPTRLLRTAAGSGRRTLSPPNLSALAELGRRILGHQPSLDTASLAWPYAVWTADSLVHGRLPLFTKAYSEFRAAWSIVSPDDLDSPDRHHPLLMLALALAGLPFKARGTIGDPNLSLRLDGADGALVMLSLIFMEREIDMFSAFARAEIASLLKRGRKRLSKKLEEAIAREDLRRGGRRIVKFLLVTEAATGGDYFIEADPA